MNEEQKNREQPIAEMAVIDTRIGQTAAGVVVEETAVAPPGFWEKVQAFMQRFNPQWGQAVHVDQILDDIINQIQQTFGYYHVQVYLTATLLNRLNQAPPRQYRNHLILQTGSGEIGRQRKAQGQTIPLTAKRSLVAQAANTRQTVVVNDTRSAAKFLPHPLLANTQAEAAFPLFSGDQLLGVLDIQHTIINYFDTEHVHTLTLIADQLANLLAHVDLHTHNNALQNQLNILQKLSEAVRDAPNEQELISVITALLGQMRRADNYGFRFLDPQSGNLRSHPSYQKKMGSRRVMAITGPGEGITGRVLVTGKPWLVHDVKQEPAYFGDPEVNSELCVPVIIGDKTIGVINLESQLVNAFSEHDQDMLMTLANLVGAALEKFRLAARSSRQSVKNDALLSTMKAISALQLEDVLTILSNEARRLLEADSSRIYLVTPDGEWLQGDIVHSRAAAAVRSFSVKMGQGITGSVALSGMGEVVPNTRHDRRAIYIPGTPVHDSTAVFAPLKLRQRVMGVMSVHRRDVSRPYTTEDLDLLTVIADQAAIAIENARLLEAERRKNEELSALHEVVTAVAAAHSEEDLIERVTRFIGQHLDADIFGVLLLNEASQTLHTHRSYCGSPMTVPVAHSIAGQVIASRKIFYTPDLSQEQAYFEANQFDNTPQPHAKLCAPLQVENQIIGIINVESKPYRVFQETDLNLLQTLAKQLSIAIEKARLFATERQRAAQQRALTAAASVLLSAYNLHDLWSTLASATQNTLMSQRIAVYLYTEDNTQLTCAFFDGFTPGNTGFFNEHTRHIPGSQMFQTRQPFIINDMTQHPLSDGMAHATATAGVHTMAFFPLHNPNRLVGILAVYRDTPTPFTENDVQSGQTLAHLVTTVLQNMQLLAEKHHAVVREKRLNEIARALYGERNLPTVLSTVIRAATELIGAEAGALGLIVDGAIIIHYPYNLPAQTQLHPQPRGRGLAWQVVETAAAIRLDEYTSHPAAEAQWIKLGLHAYLSVPIMSGYVCLGTLSLFHLTAGRQFTNRDQEMAGAIGNQAGIVIQNLRLIEESKQRANALAVSLARQERLDRLKDVFVQNISHELRTPLGIILGHAELMESGILGELQPAQQDSVKIITRRVNMLTDLVNDLSVLLAAQTQEFRREPIQPHLLINAMMDDFRLQAEAHEVHLQAEIAPDLPWINGDPTHLRRVFDNLMSNAFKFTPTGGNVTLRVWQEGDEVVFEVSDTGIGMPADQLERIFERFYQVQQKKKKKHPGGTGLGLALVKEIVEAHHGTIHVTSEEDVGSRFEIRLSALRLPVSNGGQ